MTHSLKKLIVACIVIASASGSISAHEKHCDKHENKCDKHKNKCDKVDAFVGAWTLEFEGGIFGVVYINADGNAITASSADLGQLGPFGRVFATLQAGIWRKVSKCVREFTASTVVVNPETGDPITRLGVTGTIILSNDGKLADGTIIFTSFKLEDLCLEDGTPEDENTFKLCKIEFADKCH